MQPAGSRTARSRLDKRLDRLQQLDDHHVGVTLEKANLALRAVHDAGGSPETVLIRRGFVRRAMRAEVAGDRDATPRTKPPLATALRSRGLLLRLELILLFLAQCTPAGKEKSVVRYPVIGVEGQGLGIGLIDLVATGSRSRPNTKYSRMPQALRANQVTAALEALEGPSLQLLTLDHDHRSRIERIRMYRETGPTPVGDPKLYTTPTAPDAIAVPASFFLNGWVQTLTDSEIANWLMWRDAARMQPGDLTAQDLMVWADERLGFYDLSRDVWDTHQMLRRLGLMSATFAAGRRIDGTMEDASRGARLEPHRFGLDDLELSKDGLTSTIAAVAAARDEA